MSCFFPAIFRRRPNRGRSVLRASSGAIAAPLLLILGVMTAGDSRAYGPEGFSTVIIDAGHGGIDRGGGPGQRIPEKPYTLDAAMRLQRALRSRGFRTVMTRSNDVFVPLRERVAIANSFSSRDAIFVSVHYNSAPRLGAHGYETYYYRSDSFGLAARLHRAQLATLDTEDRHVRRRGFYVVRNTSIPSVLCEGGFLTSPEESRVILSSGYRQRWADNIANAIAAQSREGNPSYMGGQPAVSSEPRISRSRRITSRHRSRASRSSRHRVSRGRGSQRHHAAAKHRSTHHRRR